jgi:hypothetical protein
MIRKLNSLKKLVLAGTIGVAGLLPAASALAGDRNDYRRYDRGDRYERRDWGRGYRDHNDTRFDFGIRIGEPYPAPATERVWVAPVYRTVCDRVWIEPAYRTECDRVWVEPVYEFRNVVRWERGRRIVCREQVLACAGHFETRERQVLVTPGHFENVERQELVAAGHWEYQTVAVAQPADSFFFRFGYNGR